MGVNTFILDRRAATLLVGSSRQTVGTLRRFYKITELDQHRAAEVVAADAAAKATPSPAAVLVMDVTELPLAGESGKPAAAHLVLGWDEGRGSVTDLGWDYLLQLGYAVRDATSRDYLLYEERCGVLHRIDDARAEELGLLDANHRLIRRGQPRIAVCHSVRRYIDGWAEADCTFDRGGGDKLLIAICEEQLPPKSWLVGKRPIEVERYPGNLDSPA
jgi:hypothetical protein